jgi:L-2,4-diaminobutyric acid acetyltransferase
MKGRLNMSIQQRLDTTILRIPLKSDGTAVWSFIRDVGNLDLNSAYCYMMLCDYFKETCLIAEADGELIGFVSAFRVPDRPNTLFIWQVAVASSQRGKGLGRKLLDELISRRKLTEALFIEATISPSNEASRALFNGIARRYDVELEVSSGYSAEWFPAESSHEDELHYRVGPIY